MKLFLPLLFGLGFIANAQPSPPNSDTAVSLGATYGYRAFHYVEIEAGVTTALNPTPELRGANYNIKPDTRFIWVPFGVRGILPLRRGRI